MAWLPSCLGAQAKHKLERHDWSTRLVFHNASRKKRVKEIKRNFGFGIEPSYVDVIRLTTTKTKRDRFAIACAMRPWSILPNRPSGRGDTDARHDQIESRKIGRLVVTHTLRRFNCLQADPTTERGSRKLSVG